MFRIDLMSKHNMLQELGTDPAYWRPGEMAAH